MNFINTCFGHDLQRFKWTVQGKNGKKAKNHFGFGTPTLYKMDWIKKLTGNDCNENYNIFTKVLKQIMDEISPIELDTNIWKKKIYRTMDE